MSQDVLIERLFQLLVSGDRTGTSRLIDDAMRRGLTVQTLARDAYTPLIRMINALHRAEQLTNLAHTYATRLLDSLLDEAGRRDAMPDAAVRDGYAAPPGVGVDRRLTWWRPGYGDVSGEPLSPASGRRRSPHESQFVRFSVRDHVLTARLAGPTVGERESPIVGTEITDVIRAMGLRLRRLVIDLSDVQVMSSMGLGMCLDLRGYARAFGAKTVVVGISTEMAPVFKRLNLAAACGRGRVSRFIGRAFAVS